MKKRMISFVIAFAMIINCLWVVPVNSANQQTISNKKYIQGVTGEVRAVWVSYLDFAPLKNKNETEFKKNVKTMFTNIKNKGMNTIYMHVRAYADAVYPSEYFPCAEFINSNMVMPAYDPFKIMIDTAHSMNLKIEAWLNPYRISTKTAYTNKLKKLEDGNIVTNWINNKENSDRILSYTKSSEQCLSFNPANEEAQNLIVNGIGEIVRNYNVDGIHFDDYFYPYTKGTTQGERKEYVNKLIAKVYKKIKSIKSNVKFGISPQGNISNCENMGADVGTWLNSDKYIDYICPQIYWSDQYTSAGTEKQFTNTLNKWITLHQNKKIKLYIGLALYKADTKPSEDKGWVWNTNNLYNQVITGRSKKVSGFVLFRYDFMFSGKTTAEMNHLINLYKTVPPKSVTLNKTKITILRKQQYTLKPTVLPANATNKNVQWSSSNNGVVKISKGVVTGLKKGTAVITCKTSLLGKTKQCTIVVKDTIVKLNKQSITLSKGKTSTIKATVLKAKSGTKSVTFKSSNTKVVTVSKNGVVKGISKGTAVVTAIAKDGSSEKATVTIKVK